MSSLALAFFIVLGQTSPTSLFLDLTSPSVRALDAETRGCESGGFGGVSDEQPPRPPQLTLALRVERFSADWLKPGQPITYDLRLTNVGDKPLMLPWSPDRAAIYGKACRDFGETQV
jgi:hypothetical protein